MSNKARLLRMKEIVGRMTLEEKAALCSGADFWTTEAIPRLGIESIWMSDGPHGVRRETSASQPGPDVLPATCYPTAAALACSFDRCLLEEIGRAMAKEAREQDVSLLLGPAVNIKRWPLGGRNFEYFSEDPYLSGELAAAQISGIQSQGVGACLKHFAVNSQETLRAVSDSCVDRRTLHDLYLEAFRIAIQQSDPVAMMSSYNKVNGRYAGENAYLISEVLRGQFGFEGAVISDWGAVFDRVEGIRAGLDLEMPGKTSDTTEEIIKAVQDGQLDQALLDDAAARVLDLVGRCAAPPVAPPADSDDSRHALARRAAAESAVLLKNIENLLPFDDGRPFAVIGRMAQAPPIQGAGSACVNPKQKTCALEEFKTRGLDYYYAEGYNKDGSTNDILIAEARQAVAQAGRAVIFAGLPQGVESEGFDRAEFGLPDGMLKLIDIIASECPDTAVYLMLGAPVAVPFAGRVKGILCGYLGGQAAGQAAADLITGRVSPGGRLAESWPQKISDLPGATHLAGGGRLMEYREGPYVGYRYFTAAAVDPLFAFGHGLAYTRFLFDNVTCDRRTLAAGEQATVSVRITNTGLRDGYAVAQIYVNKKDHPMLQLKQFEKIHLFAGESRIVSCPLDLDSFACYHPERNCRCVEMGDYTISVGAASDDIKGRLDITVWPPEHDELPPHMTVEQAVGQDDADFYHLLGFKPTEPPRRPFTLNSTLNELKTSAFGKLMYAALEKHPIPGDDGTFLEKAGDTPLRFLCANSRGLLSKNKAKAIVHLANRQLLRGIFFAIKK